MVLPRSSSGMQNIGEHFRRRRSPPVAAENADADRAVEFAAIVDAEGEIVRLVIVPVGDALGFRWQDRALAQVGAVAQTIDLVLFLGRFGEAVIYMFQGSELRSGNNAVTSAADSHSLLQAPPTTSAGTLKD